jgi:hypothetical protein
MNLIPIVKCMYFVLRLDFLRLVLLHETRCIQIDHKKNAPANIFCNDLKTLPFPPNI